MTLDTLQNGLAKITGTADELIGNNTAASIGVALGVGAITGATVAGIVSSKNTSNKTHKKASKKKRGRITHTRRGWKQDRKRFNKRQKWEVAYRKRKHKKSKSKKGIHYTKNGQPYKILASGKARFIKKR